MFYQIGKAIRRLGLLVGVLLLALLPIVALVLPVWAIGNPTSVAISELAVFRNLLETGDCLYYVRYNVVYSPVPSEDADDTWEMAIYDTDGTTLVDTRPLNYYQHNIISMYFSASQWTAKGLAWGDALYIKIRGMPSIFSPLVEGLNMRTTTLVAGDYKATSDFGPYVIAQAKILEVSWGLDLVDTNDKLNTTGATYFKKAIPGLDTMVPSIFEVITSVPTVVRENWTRAKQAEYSNNAGARMKQAFTDIGGFFGSTGGWTSFYALVLVCGMVGAGLFASTKQPAFGLVMCIPLLAAWAWLGLGADLLVALVVVAIVVAILFGIVFILGRVG